MSTGQPAGIGAGVCASAFAFAFAFAAPARAVPDRDPRRELVRVDARKLEAELALPTRGPRLLHVWASWCGPCRAELPALARALRARERRGLDITALALDEPSAEPEVRRLLGKAGAFPGKLRVALPGEAHAVLAKIDPEWDGSVPGSYLLDARGKLLFAQRGLTVIPELMSEIDRVLGQP